MVMMSLLMLLEAVSVMHNKTKPIIVSVKTTATCHHQHDSSLWWVSVIHQPYANLSDPIALNIIPALSVRTVHNKVMCICTQKTITTSVIQQSKKQVKTQ